MNLGQNNTLDQLFENSEPTIKRDLRALRRERTVRLEEAGEWSGDPFEQLREAMAPVQFQCVKTGEAPTPEGWCDAGLEVVPGSIEWDVDALERNLYGDREGFSASLRKAVEPQTNETIVEDFGRGMRAIFVGADVEMSYRDLEDMRREPVVTFDWPLEGSHSVTAKDPLVGLVNNPRFARGGSGGGKRAAIALALAMAELGYVLKDVVVIGSGGRLGHFDYAVFDECSHFDNNLSAHPGERHRQLSRKLTSRRSRAGKAGRWA